MNRIHAYASRTRSPSARVLALGLTLTLGACGTAQGGEPALAGVREIESPAPPRSSEPNLTVGPDGRVHLTWIEALDAGGHALRFAVLDEAGWSEPGTIATGDDWFVNWADFPSLAVLPDGGLAAHWLQKSGPGTYAYDVRIALSADGGRSWSEPVTPHRDGTQTEHGFVSLWAEGDSVAAVWLDGRNFTGDGHSTANEMTLRYTRVGPDGGLGEEQLLDGRICDCCQTAVALTSRGPVVFYRDRSPEEIRDIWMVRQVDGAWSEPEAVHRDGWEIAACPVNGPAAAAEGERVAVAWFTAAHDTARVNVAFSDDAGARFGAPVRVDGGAPLGRVGVQLLPDGSALVSWLERGRDEQARVQVRRVAADGTAGPTQTVAESTGARSSGFPRMVRSGDRVVFAWTAAGDPSRVRVATAALEGGR
jgi:hypothetical protein